MNDQSGEEVEKVTPAEAAQQVYEGLKNGGFTLTEKGEVVKKLRTLLRTEAEDVKKSIETLLESL